MTTASICTIGDEILIGQIVDTNSSAIAQRLQLIGVKVLYMISISDDRQEILSKLTQCLESTDIVIVTGGLGPTKDDITKDALLELSDSTCYVENAEQLEIVKNLLGRRGIEISNINRDQALVPENCNVIPNRLGTAPIMEFVFEEGRFGHKAALYSMPGVPFETIGALGDVMARISDLFPLEKIMHRTVVTFGIAESTLAKRIEEWEDALPEYLHLAYLPNPTVGVRLRLSLYGADDAERVKELDKAEGELREMLKEAVYGSGEDTLQSTLPSLLSMHYPADYQATLSVAESCTGGHLSELITSVPGASAYYKGGIISYAVEVKEKVLGVDPQIIEEHGVVSRECAEAMARGAAMVLDTDYSISTTGIAGPGGGTADLKVGTCWIAAARRDRATGKTEVASKMLSFGANRAVNVERFASNALNLLRELIINK